MTGDQIVNRVKSLQHMLAQRHIEAAVITLSRDLYYYTGTAQPCLFIVTPGDYRLLVRRAHDFVINETFLDREKIVDSGSSRDALKALREMGAPNGALGFELDVIPAAQYLKMKKTYAHYTLVDISPLVLEQRMTKDDTEIEALRTACRMMDLGHRRVMETLHPGMTELELAAEIEYVHRRAGHEGVLSMRQNDVYISRGPLSAGQNLFKVSGFSNTVTGIGQSPAIPAGPSNTKIDQGDLVVTDIPTCHRGYHCDQTRTYFLGKVPAALKDLFSNLREISDQAMFHLKHGITCGELFEVCRSHAARLGLEDYFLGLAPKKANFIGHGLGLDTNEPPILFQNSDYPLGARFVLTIELHLTRPEVGVVKLEDVVLVKENGCELLSVTPRELFEIGV